MKLILYWKENSANFKSYIELCKKMTKCVALKKSVLLEDFKQYTVQLFWIKHLLNTGWKVPVNHFHDIKELKKKQSSSPLLAVDKLKIVEYVAKQGKYLPDVQDDPDFAADENWIVNHRDLLITMMWP